MPRLHNHRKMAEEKKLSQLYLDILYIWNVRSTSLIHNASALVASHIVIVHKFACWSLNKRKMQQVLLVIPFCCISRSLRLSQAHLMPITICDATRGETQGRTFPALVHLSMESWEITWMFVRKMNGAFQFLIKKPKLNEIGSFSTKITILDTSTHRRHSTVLARVRFGPVYIKVTRMTAILVTRKCFASE